MYNYSLKEAATPSLRNETVKKTSLLPLMILVEINFHCIKLQTMSKRSTFFYSSPKEIKRKVPEERMPCFSTLSKRSGSLKCLYFSHRR